MMSAVELLFACQTQLEKDSTDERRAQFDYFLSRRPVVRLIYRVAERMPVGLRAAFCLFYAALVSARPAKFPHGSLLLVEKYANEKKQMDFLMPIFGVYGFYRWPMQSLGCFLFSVWYFGQRQMAAPRSERFFSLARRICRRYTLFSAMRAMETALNYVYFRETLRKKGVRVVASSSDGNPHGRALMAAAYSERVPLIFISHGAIADKTVKAKADLAVLFGVRALSNFLKCGSLINNVLFWGFKRDSHGIQVPRVPKKFLICLGPAPSLAVIGATCAKLEKDFPEATIVVRAHPHSHIGPAGFRRVVGGRRTEFSFGREIEKDFASADLLLAASSTVHLEGLVAGKPSVFVPELDSTIREPLSFLREGLVMQWADFPSAPLNLNALTAFYGRPEIMSALGEYMNLKETKEDFLGNFDRQLSKVIRR